MRHVLFVCARNRLRSPTAEEIFSGYPGIDVASAGLNPDADSVLTGELVAWADLIFVMEKAQREKLTQRFRPLLRDKRVVCLDIADRYAFMDPALVRLLKARVSRFLR